MVSLSNFVMPHKSRRQGHTPRTPAMAIGLTAHVGSSREYIWIPVQADPVRLKQLDDRIARLLIPALQAQPKGRTPTPPPVEATEGHAKDAAPLPKAA